LELSHVVENGSRPRGIPECVGVELSAHDRRPHLGLVIEAPHGMRRDGACVVSPRFLP
jgi:hypothetical protein